MISPYLLDFINKIFCELYNYALTFGGLIVLVIGDLAQLPLINAPFVFKSVSWDCFISPILFTSKCLQILQEIRFNQISDKENAIYRLIINASLSNRIAVNLIHELRD